MSHAFSEKAIKEQEYLIQSHVDIMIDFMRTDVKARNVDLVEWIDWALFDIVGDLAFAEPFEALQGSTARAWASMITLVTRSYSKLGIFS